MMIYKILRAPEWKAFRRSKETTGAPVDLADGFIHFSTAKQVAETAKRHFAGQDDLWLLAVDGATLGADLKWEPSRDNNLFPHLFADLHMDQIVWAQPLLLGPNGHRFPDELI